MKLCIVTRKIVKGDGQGRANYEIVCEAVRRGHQVILVANSVAPELVENKQIEWVYVPIKGWPIELLREIAFSLFSAVWLRKHHSDFDLVQVYGAVTSFPSDINTATFVHSGWLQSPAHISRLRQDYYGAYQWLYTLLNARWEKKAFHQAKVVVAVSERIKQELLDIGVPDKSIHVILNGVDLEEFLPGTADREGLGLPNDVSLALFAGDIRLNRKNLDTVLYALVKVPELHLAVVGSTEGSPYPRLAEALGLSSRVHFLGFRHDLPEIMKAVDFFVFPSRYEPFGMVVSEAMASGLPVVTVRATGASEIVTPDCGIVLLDPEDRNGLAQALDKFARDPDLRKQMGRAGRATVEEHSWASKAQSYVNLFETMAPVSSP
jgi:glycosyltransferase involved in cell wall biosynthesis